LVEYIEMKNQNLWMKFLFRWLASSLGLWIASAFLGAERLSVSGHWVAWIIAGFILAVVNMLLKPFLLFLSFPAILITLGLFMLVVNGFLILVVHWIYPTLYVKNLGVAIVAGIILGLVNWLMSQVLEDFSKK
jgi:putative membrane protein